MKKLACAFLFFSLLLLAFHGCRPPVSETPPATEPPVSPPAESVSPSPSPLLPSDPVPSESEPTAEPEPPEEDTEEEELFLPADGILFPEFLVHFDFDRADWLDVNEHRDYAICLMGEDECRTLKSVLDPTAWTVATDIPAMGLEPAYILYDHAGDSLVVTPWEEDRCLIIAAEHTDEGDVHRYFAPTYVLDRFNDFLTGLTPLSGTVSTSEEQYYHLFQDDAGIEALITLATADGSLSDEQLYTYATLRIPDYNFKHPHATYAYDAVTTLHFGRTVANPVGNTTGYDFDCHLVLQEEHMDDEGTITALFQCYSIPEYYWEDNVLPDLQMRHIKEHLLTGNDEGFPAPVPVEIVFEIHFDIPTQTSFLYYHSVKVLSSNP